MAGAQRDFSLRPGKNRRDNVRNDGFVGGREQQVPHPAKGAGIRDDTLGSGAPAGVRLGRAEARPYTGWNGGTGLVFAVEGGEVFFQGG